MRNDINNRNFEVYKLVEEINHVCLGLGVLSSLLGEEYLSLCFASSFFPASCCSSFQLFALSFLSKTTGASRVFHADIRT